MRGILWLAEDLLASQEGLFSMELCEVTECNNEYNRSVSKSSHTNTKVAETVTSDA
jgi:hypothetical protein